MTVFFFWTSPCFSFWYSILLFLYSGSFHGAFSLAEEHLEDAGVSVEEPELPTEEMTDLPPVLLVMVIV